MEGAKLKGFRRSGIAVVGVLQVLQRCRRIDGQRENKLNRVGREGRPRKMRPSLNGLDETRRANQSDSREAASSARNVFDVARFTVYNRHPIIGFQPPISNPAWYGGREGGGGGGKNTKPGWTSRASVRKHQTVGGEKKSPLNRMMGADG